MNALIQTLLDLDEALGGEARLLVGGGLGLYLKQEHLKGIGAKTLLPARKLPPSRVTQDIDLFVRGEVISSLDEVEKYRAAMDQIGLEVVPNAKWLKFGRTVGSSEITLDLMVGPLVGQETTTQTNGIRVRPRGLPGSKGFHARKTDEAIGVECSPLQLSVTGTEVRGTGRSCEIAVPRALPYALMKLGAFRDRVGDPNKDEGRHHAMDLYRIVGMLTEEEEVVNAEIATIYGADPQFEEGRRVVEEFFAPKDGVGRIRLLEYQRADGDSTVEIDPEFLCQELRRMLAR